MAKGDAGRAQDRINETSSRGYNYMDQLQGGYRQLSGYNPGMSSGYQSGYNPTPGVQSGGVVNASKDPRQPNWQPRTAQPSSSGYGPSSGGKDPTQYIQSRFSALPNTDEGFNQLVSELQSQGYNVQRPYRGRGMSGPQSNDKLVINGRMVDVRSDNGWQFADIGSADEHGYGPGGDGVYRGDGGNGGGGQGYLGGLQQALGGFGDFAQTGGFSGQDIQDIRARALSPIRANYSLAKDELERHKNLSGGYMPNYAPALAKMNREQNYAMSDANVGASAMLAEQIRNGRLAGLGGLSSLGLGLGNQELQLANMGNNFGLGLVDSQIKKSQIPSTFQQAMGNIGSVAGIVSPFF